MSNLIKDFDVYTEDGIKFIANKVKPMNSAYSLIASWKHTIILGLLVIINMVVGITTDNPVVYTITLVAGLLGLTYCLLGCNYASNYLEYIRTTQEDRTEALIAAKAVISVLSEQDTEYNLGAKLEAMRMVGLNIMGEHDYISGVRNNVVFRIKYSDINYNNVKIIKRILDSNN